MSLMRAVAFAALFPVVSLCFAQAPAWQRTELGAAGARYPFAIYSNKPWSGDMSRVKSAVLVLHGAARNGDDYERPKGTAWAPFDAAACPEYNEYRYGMEKMVRYAGNASGPELFRRYAARDVTYLLGTADIDPNHRSIDKSCGARANGAYRLERGRNYLRYERHLAGSAVKLNRHAYEVVGVGHDQANIFGSKCGASLLFGTPEVKNESGAACRAPELAED